MHIDLPSTLDSLLDAFDSAWQRPSPPRLEDFLPPQGDPHYRNVLVELVRIDLERRIKAREQARVEDYLQRFPDLGAGDGVLAELLHAEMELRLRAGEVARVEDYLRRFPELAQQPQWAERLARPVADRHPPPAQTPTPWGAADATAARPGIRGYEILGELGRGGMGVVYQARQASLNRLVALKMIRGGPEGDEALARFRTEAQTIARLAHPNIVQVYEVGEHDGQPFLALELVAGGSLDRQLNGTPCAPREAARLTEVLARAMHSAHTAGVIHRDLKPANVLLGADGLLKITDFGLAKLLDADSGQTRTGQVLGTPSYMAPEQAIGEGHHVEAAADVYALGAILYECLTGRPPFKGATVLETLEQVQLMEPVSPRQLNAVVPRDLETVCLKCLQKEPRKRYATALEFADDLRRFLAGEPVRARPVGQAERLWRWCRRNPAVAGLQAAVAATLLAGMAVALLLASRAEENARRADNEAAAARANAAEAVRQEEIAGREARAAEAGERRARAGEESARRSLYLASMGWGLSAARDGQPSRIDALLERTRPAAGETDLRCFEWYHLERLRHGEVRTLHGHKAVVSALAFSPDGKRLASGAHDRLVRIWDFPSGRQLLALAGHGAAVSWVAFSPDAQRLASSSDDGTVRVWDAATGRPLHVLRGHPGAAFCVAFSPDGKRLVSSGGQGSVTVWEAATGKALVTARARGDAALSVAFSPDGRRLAAAGMGGRVNVLDAATGELVFDRDGHAVRAAFSPDGKWLASGWWDGRLVVLSAATGEVRFDVNGLSGAIHCVAYSPDGRRLASAGADGTVKVSDAATGGQFLPFLGHTGEVYRVAYSPDGRWLASGGADGTVKLWDAAGPRECDTWGVPGGAVASVAFRPDGMELAAAREAGGVDVWDVAAARVRLRLRGHQGIVMGVAYSRDGRLLASAGRDRTVRIWDLESGKELHCLKGHRADVYRVAFSPDGRRLLSGGEDRTVLVWDAVTGRELRTLSGHAGTVSDLAVGEGGKLLATASLDGTVKVWETVSGKDRLTFKSHTDRVSGVAFSPDGRRLASAGTDRTVQVWDAGTGRVLLTLRGHTAAIAAVGFSPDGRRLASGDEHGVVKVWEAASGQELLTLRIPGPPGQVPVWAIAFSPDGRGLATASHDGALRLWGRRPGPSGEKPALHPGEPENAPPGDLFLEGESLEILGQSPATQTRVQQMTPFQATGKWSNNAQLFCPADRVGAWTDLKLPVPADGKYRVTVWLTRAPDFGRIVFKLNGQRLGEPFDGYQAGEGLPVVSSGPVDLGVATLSKGSATLRVEVIGTNPQSGALRYHWGLDVIRLRPVP